MTGPAEAMAAGLAILASHTSDLATLLRDQQTALLVRPDHPRSAAMAMLRLIEEPDLAGRLGQNARTAAKAFRPERIRNVLEGIYATCTA